MRANEFASSYELAACRSSYDHYDHGPMEFSVSV